MARIEQLPQPLPFGKYELLERIDSGRMGEIFKAKKRGVEGFEKILVVKRLFRHLSQNEAFISTFVEESKVTVSLSHANIVQVLDLGQQDDYYFMAEEYVPGYDLGTCSTILAYLGRDFPLDIAVFGISEVAKGLDYAHRRKDYNFESLNIVHRDLCPHNILLSFEGEVKISDFGISRALEAAGTANDDLRRRYLYASPEQARGERATARSDIFSVGLGLYQLITGVHPYENPDGYVVAQNAQNAQIRPIQEMADIPRALVQIVNSTLAVDPEERVDSAGTLYEELISYLFASGQKADNRSLSLFMQDLRTSEEIVFPHGNRPLPLHGQGQAQPEPQDQGYAADPWGAPPADPYGHHGAEPEPEEDVLEFDDLEELGDDDMMLEDDAHSDDYGQGFGNDLVAPPVDGGLGRQGTFDRMAGFVDASDGRAPTFDGPALATWDEPAPPARARALDFDQPLPDHVLPEWLDGLTATLMEGQQAVFLLAGELGVAYGHLPDRLPELLGQRGVDARLLVSTPNHTAIPFGLAARIVYALVGMPDWTLLWGDQIQQRERTLDQGAIDHLTQLGFDEGQQTLAAHLCGLVDALDVGLHSRKEATYLLIEAALETMARQKPLALILDGIEHLDALSIDLLLSLAQMPPSAGVAIIVASGDPDFAARLSARSGGPLPALELQGRPSDIDEEAVIHGLDADAMAVLTALALVEQPLPVSVLGDLLQLGTDAVQQAIGTLQQRGGLRSIDPDRVFPANPALLSILHDELALGTMPRADELAEALIALTRRSDLPEHDLSGPWAPVRARLHAWLHQRGPAFDIAAQHADALAFHGYLGLAADHLMAAQRSFVRAELGSLRARVGLALQTARFGLKLMRIDLAQAAIEGLSGLAASASDSIDLLDLHTIHARIALILDAPWDAFAWYQEILRGSASLDQADVLARAHLGMAVWHCNHGSLREAEQQGLATLNLLERYSFRWRDPILHAEALSALIDIAIARDNPRFARTHFETLQHLAALWHNPEIAAHVALGRLSVATRGADAAHAITEALAAADVAADHELVQLQLRLIDRAARAALDTEDLRAADAAARHGLAIATAVGHLAIAQRLSNLLSLIGVMTSTGDRALEALQGLQLGLTRAVERKAVRDQFDAHYLLFRALNHLGSGADADHHREEALRFGLEVGIDVVHLEV